MFGFLFNKKVLTRLTRFMICSFLMIYCMAFTVYAGDPDTRVKTYLNLSVDDDIYADENGTVFFTVFADIYGETGYLTGDVIISFDGCNYTVPIINESSVFMINDIVEPGDYYIKAWFGGDENYQNSTDSKMITIHPLKQPTSIRLDDEKEIHLVKYYIPSVEEQSGQGKKTEFYTLHKLLSGDTTFVYEKLVSTSDDDSVAALYSKDGIQLEPQRKIMEYILASMKKMGLTPEEFFADEPEWIIKK